AKPAPYENRAPRRPKQDLPKTSVVTPQSSKRQNLTLYDKVQILDFIDKNLGIAQHRICEHFANRPQGALIFTQATVSCITRDRNQLLDRAESNSNALSSKRPCVVTRPDVERALYLWVQHLNGELGETASGPMLEAKRLEFEKAFNVQEKERLTGRG
ncbi:hypothetical protein GGU10DRAFT_248935, partial [Lentinula aff. detonsa]